MDVDATMEALHQQHDIDVQAYKARIEHLETMLASLGIREHLELLPSFWWGEHLIEHPK